nr:NADH dehydrogenase subunit 3 [Namystynia karyoxenos]
MLQVDTFMVALVIVLLLIVFVIYWVVLLSASTAMLHSEVGVYDAGIQTCWVQGVFNVRNEFLVLGWVVWWFDVEVLGVVVVSTCSSVMCGCCVVVVFFFFVVLCEQTAGLGFFGSLL